MNNFVKIALILAAIAAAFYFCPILFAPLGAIVGVTAMIASLIGAAFFALAGVGVTALGALLSLVVLLAVGLSPLWLPILCVIGLVHLVRRTRTSPVTVATPIP